MARSRKKTTQKRRTNSAINLMNVLEGFVQANIISTTATNLSAYNFLMSNEENSGASKITLRELINNFGTVHHGTSLTEGGLVWQNVKDNWAGGLTQMVVAKVGFSVAKKMTSKLRRQVNSGLKQMGMGSTVRV